MTTKAITPTLSKGRKTNVNNVQLFTDVKYIVPNSNNTPVQCLIDESASRCTEGCFLCALCIMHNIQWTVCIVQCNEVCKVLGGADSVRCGVDISFPPPNGDSGENTSTDGELHCAA